MDIQQLKDKFFKSKIEENLKLNKSHILDIVNLIRDIDREYLEEAWGMIDFEKIKCIDELPKEMLLKWLVDLRSGVFIFDRIDSQNKNDRYAAQDGYWSIFKGRHANGHSSKWR